MDAFELAGSGQIQKLGFIDNLQAGIDIQVRLQLGLDLLSNGARLLQVTAPHIPVIDDGIKPIRKSSLRQELLRPAGVEIIPGVSSASVRNRARGEVRGNLRTGRE